MTYRFLSCVTLASAAIATPAIADTAAPTDELSALRAEVAALRGRVNELEGTDAWATEARADEVRAIVADALADADGRTSFLQSSSGWNNGFKITDGTGNYSLQVTGGTQFRWIASLQDNSGGDDTVAGFENTRTRFGFKGNIIDPTWQYFIWGGWGAGGNTVLLEANVTKDLENGWKIKAGQFKLPTWQEWTFSEYRQQFVERSVLDARFAQSYSQGVMAAYSTDDWRASFTFSDGLRTLNTAYNGGGPTTPGYSTQTDYAFTGRFEYKAAGDWSAVSDYTGTKGATNDTIVIGGGVHYQSDESGTAANEVELTEFNIDANLQWDGANLFAGMVYRSLDDDAALDRDEYGFLIQGGYYLADDLELIARYEHGDLDGGGGVGGDDLSILTFGVNKYWASHNLKWTTDIGFALDPVDGNWGGAGRGWRGDAANEDGQIVIRSQLQLWF